jgi:arylsulfatase A-like enzyme
MLLRICLLLSLISALAKPPNVVVIMTDDQGYGDLSFTENAVVITPHMDRIANEGAWFKQFYVSPVCTPTRAHLMTGRYGYRTRAFDTYLGRANMEPDEVTIAEILQDAGYSTGIFGKWHLGDYYPTRAMDQGFQESLVHQGGGLRQPANPPEGDRYHDPILYHNGEPKRYEGYCTDIFFDEAIRHIQQQAKAEKPFFTYISTNAPHGPFDEPPTRELMEHFVAKFPKEKTTRKACFYAMVKNIDDNIGRLILALQRLQIDEETLIVFLTDNGPSGGLPGPFRGAKASVFEGGIRTVCFMRWPDVITAGTRAETTAAHIDLLPTILDFCEVALPEGLDIDGRSLRPLLPEERVVKPTPDWPDRHLFLQWHRGDVPQRYHHIGVVGPQGRWKLVARANRGEHIPSKAPNFELFDLFTDPGERIDVADKHPEVIATHKAAYDAWFDDVCSTRTPNFGMPPIVIGAPQAPTVVLTPQDKRVDEVGGEGWWAPGSWPVDIRRPGPYTIKVLLNGLAPSGTTVDLRVVVGDAELHKQLTIPRGVDSAAIGEVALPAGGLGLISARVSGDNSPVAVNQVTIK